MMAAVERVDPSHYRVIGRRSNAPSYPMSAICVMCDTIGGQPATVVACSASSKHPALAVLDSHSGAQIGKTAPIPTQTTKVLCTYVPALRRVVVAWGAYLRILPHSPNDPGLAIASHWFDSSLTAVRPGCEDEPPVTIALSAANAEILAKTLKHAQFQPSAALSAGKAVGLTDSHLQSLRDANIHEALVRQLESLNDRTGVAAVAEHRASLSLKQIALASQISVPVPRCPMAAFCVALLSPRPGQDELPVTSLPAICSVLEQLQWTVDGRRVDPSEMGGVVTAGMHVEWLRLQSFDHAMVSVGAESLADAFAAAVPSLADAGFYFFKNTGADAAHVSGFCVHFETGASVPVLDCPSFRNLLSNPIDELQVLCPDCNFLRGKPTANVSLNVSFGAIPSQWHAAPYGTPPVFDRTVAFMTACPCPRTPVLATASSDGVVCVWHTNPLRSVYNIPSLQPVAESAEGSVEAWSCPECSYDNGDGELRCGMCDSAAPGASLATASAVVEGGDSLSTLVEFLKEDELTRLTSVIVIPNAPNVSLEGLAESAKILGDCKPVGEEHKGEGSASKFASWGNGWVAPSIEVTIISGMYAGVGGKVIETGPDYAVILTAFESIERFPKDSTSNEKLASYIKVVPPTVGDKALVLFVTYDLPGFVPDQHLVGAKGKTVVVVAVTGRLASCKFRQSDPPSMCFNIPIESLAKLGMTGNPDFSHSDSKVGDQRVVDEHACEGCVAVVVTSAARGSMLCTYRRENCETRLVDVVRLPEATRHISSAYSCLDDAVILSYEDVSGQVYIRSVFFSHEKETFSAPSSFVLKLGQLSPVVSIQVDAKAILFLTANGVLRTLEPKSFTVIHKTLLPDFSSAYTDFKLTPGSLCDSVPSVGSFDARAIAMDAAGHLIKFHSAIWQNESLPKHNGLGEFENTGGFPLQDEPITSVRLKRFHQSMTWVKLQFRAYGPPGRLRTSFGPSGTTMRWRAQTAYFSEDYEKDIMALLNDGVALSFQPPESPKPYGYMAYCGMKLDTDVLGGHAQSKSRVLGAPSSNRLICGWASDPESTTTDIPVICPRRHGMQILDKQPEGYSGWYCDHCVRFILPLSKGVAHCTVCEYDICPECIANGLLPSGDCRPLVVWEHQVGVNLWQRYSKEHTRALNLAWAQGINTVNILDRYVHLKEMCDVNNQTGKMGAVRRLVDPELEKDVQQLCIDEVEYTSMLLVHPWHARVPNGTYEVTVKVGDAYKEHVNSLLVNDILVFDKVVIDACKFFSRTVRVNVVDHTLTLSPSKDSSIDFPSIVSVYIHRCSPTATNDVEMGSEDVDVEPTDRPRLVRQHSDIMGARDSAKASELSWEIEFSAESTLAFLDARLELHTEQLTAEESALMFTGECGGIICPVLFAASQEAASCTVEAWVRPNWDVGAPPGSGANARWPYTVMSKTTFGEAHGVGELQFEVVVHIDGTVQVIVYRQELKTGKPVESISTQINPKLSLRLHTYRWSHIAVAVKNVPVGGPSLTLYVDGEFCATMYPSQRPVIMVPEVQSVPFGPLVVGSAGRRGRPFKGCVRHVRMWHGVRSQTEIRECMHSSQPEEHALNESVLIGSWPFDNSPSDAQEVQGNAFYSLRSLIGLPALHIENIEVSTAKKMSMKSIRTETTSWDYRRSSKKIHIEDASAVYRSMGSSYASVFSADHFKVGKHYWEVIIDKVPQGKPRNSEMFVGVCELSMANNTYVGQNNGQGNKGWGYYASGGQKYNSSSFSYGASYGKIGDVVGVSLDCDVGVLSFSLNGENQGVAYESKALKNRELALCVSMYRTGQGVVLSTSQFPSLHTGFSASEKMIEQSEMKRAQNLLTDTPLLGVQGPPKTQRSAGRGLSWVSIPVPKMDFAPALELRVAALDDEKCGGNVSDPIVSQLLEANDVSLKLNGEVARKLLVTLSRDDNSTPFEITSVTFCFRGKPGLNPKSTVYASNNVLRDKLYLTVISPSTTDCVKQLAISLLEQGLCDANAPKELNDLLCDDGAMLKQFLVNNIIKAESAKTAKNTTGLVEAFVRWDDRHPDRFERTNCRRAVALSILSLLPRVQELAISSFGITQLFRLLREYWDETPNQALEECLILLRQLSNVCSTTFSHESKLLRQMFNLNVCLLDEFNWPLGSSSAIRLENMFDAACLPQFSIQSNFAHFNIEVKAPKPLHVHIDLKNNVSIEHMSLLVSKTRNELCAARTVLYARSVASGYDIHTDDHDHPWEPVYSLSVDPKSGTQYLRACQVSKDVLPIVANQLRITSHCVEWGSGTLKGTSTPKIPSEVSLKMMFCVYGTEIFVPPGLSLEESQAPLSTKLDAANKDKKRKLSMIKMKRLDIRETIRELEICISSSKDDRANAISCDILSGIKSHGGSRSTSGENKTDSLLLRIQELDVMATNLKATNPVRTLLKKLSCFLQSLTLDLIEYQQLEVKVRSLKNLLIETGKDLSDSVRSMWETTGGCAMFLASEVLITLNEQEQRGLTFADGEMRGLPSSKLTVDDCHDLFFVFAVSSPPPPPLDDAVSIMIRNALQCHASKGGGTGKAAAHLPVRLLLDTLGGGGSKSLGGINERSVFAMIHTIAAPTGFSAKGYCLGTLVETLSLIPKFEIKSMGWALLLLSKLLASSQHQNEDPEHSDVHPGTKCAITGMSPITGPRFYCVTRPNFDICQAAWKDHTNSEMLWNDVFLKIDHPMPLPPFDKHRTISNEVLRSALLPDLYMPEPSDQVLRTPRSWDPNVLHEGVICDNGLCPNPGADIRGTRYMSVTDDSYNLCASCEAKGVANERSPKPILAALRRPLPTLGNTNPSAMVSDPFIIGTLLNTHSDRPVIQRFRKQLTTPQRLPKHPLLISRKSPVSEKQIEDGIARIQTDDEVLANPHLLCEVFNLVTTTASFQPLFIELFLLATNIFCQVAAKACSSSVDSIMNKPGFATYLRSIACAHQPFAHSAAMRLTRAMLSLAGENVGGVINRDRLEATRVYLRDSVLEELVPRNAVSRRSSSPFLLELLLVILSFRPGTEDAEEARHTKDDMGNEDDLTLQIRICEDSYVVTLSKVATVMDVKVAIGDLTGIDPKIQTLKTSDEALGDDLSLRDQASIMDGAKTIFLSIDNTKLRPEAATEVEDFLCTVRNENPAKHACLELASTAIQSVIPSQMSFEPSMCYKDYSVSNDGKTLCLDKQAHANFRTGLVNTPITDGIVSWDILCEKTSSQKYTFIGVTEWPSDISKQQAIVGSYLGGSSSVWSWGYYSVSKKCYSRSQTKAYGKQYCTGDVVTCVLDMINDTLSFAINGEDQGVAYSGCFKGRVLYPAVSLYGPQECVSVQSSNKASAIFVSDEELDVAEQADREGPWAVGSAAIREKSDGVLECEACILDEPMEKMGLLSEVTFLLGNDAPDKGWAVHVYSKHDNQFKLKTSVPVKPINGKNRLTFQTSALEYPVTVEARQYVGIGCAEGKIYLRSIDPLKKSIGWIYQGNFPSLKDFIVPMTLYKTEGLSVALQFHFKPVGVACLGLFQNTLGLSDNVALRSDDCAPNAGIEMQTPPRSKRLDDNIEGMVKIVVRCWSHQFCISVPYTASVDHLKGEIYKETGFPLKSQILYISAGNGSETILALLGKESSAIIGRLRGIRQTRVVHVVCVVPKHEYQDIVKKRLQIADTLTILPTEAAMRLMNFMVTTPFRTEQSALSWNSCFRLIQQFSQPQMLLSSPDFMQKCSIILRSVLVANGSLVAVVAKDMFQMINDIYSSSENSDILKDFRACIFSAVVDTFSIASRLKSALFRQLLVATRKHISRTLEWDGIEIKLLGRMFGFVSQILVAESGEEDSVSLSELKVVLEATQFINTILKLCVNDVKSRCAFVNMIMVPNFDVNIIIPPARIALDWLAVPSIHKHSEKQLLCTRIGEMIMETFFVAVADESPAFIPMLMEVIQTWSTSSTPSRIVELAVSIARANESCANSFAMELLESGVFANSYGAHERFDVETSASFIPEITRTLSVPSSKSSKKCLTNRCRVVAVQGSQSIGKVGFGLSELLQHQSANTSSPKPSRYVRIDFPDQDDDPVWEATFRLPEDVVVSSVVIKCVGKYSATASHPKSALPATVAVSTGLSSSRLCRVGSAEFANSRKLANPTSFGSSFATPTGSSNTNAAEMATAQVNVVGVTAARLLKVTFSPSSTISQQIGDSKDGLMPKYGKLSTESVAAVPHALIASIKIEGTTLADYGGTLSNVTYTSTSNAVYLQILAAACETYESVKSALATELVAESLIPTLLPHVPTCKFALRVLLMIGKQKHSLSQLLLQNVLEFPLLSQSYAQLASNLCKSNEGNVLMLWKFVSEKLDTGKATFSMSSCSVGLLHYVKALSGSIDTHFTEENSPAISFPNILTMFERILELIVNIDVDPYSTTCHQFLVTLIGHVDKTLLQTLVNECEGNPVLIERLYPLIGMVIGAHPQLLSLVEDWVVQTMHVFCVNNKSGFANEDDLGNAGDLAATLSMFANLAFSGRGQDLVGQHVLEGVICALSTVCSRSKRADHLIDAGLRLVENAWNIHLENQQLVTRVINDTLGAMTRLEPFMRKLLVKTFQMKEVVYVSVRSTSVDFGGWEDVNMDGRAIAPLLPTQFGWEPSTCPDGLSIRGSCVEYTGTTAAAYLSAAANRSFKSGINEWEVELTGEGSNNMRDSFIGVAESNAVQSYCGSAANGWGYYGSNGYAYHGKSQPYGKSFKQGDTVTVRLDSTEGTLSYIVNGEDQGIAFGDLQGLELFPVVSLYRCKDSVRIRLKRSSIASLTKDAANVHKDVSIDSLGGWCKNGTSGSLRGNEIVVAPNAVSMLRNYRVYAIPVNMTFLDFMLVAGNVNSRWSFYGNKGEDPSSHESINPISSFRELAEKCQGNGIVDLHCSESDVVQIPEEFPAGTICGTWSGYIRCKYGVFAFTIELAAHESVLSGPGTVYVPRMQTVAHMKLLEGCMANISAFAVVEEHGCLHLTLSWVSVRSEISLDLPGVKRHKSFKSMFVSEIALCTHKLRFACNGTAMASTCSTHGRAVAIRGDYAAASCLWPLGMLEHSDLPAVAHAGPNRRGPTLVVTSPVLSSLAERGGLKKMMSLIKGQLLADEGNKLEPQHLYKDLQEQADAALLSKRKRERKLWQWLSSLEGNIELPGFAAAFVGDHACVTLLLNSLSVDISSMSSEASVKKYLVDPIASQVAALSHLFTISKNDPKKALELHTACLRNGVIDRLLLRIGTLQSEDPRNPEWTEKFEDPVAVQERKQKAEKKKQSTPVSKTVAQVTAKDGSPEVDQLLWKPGFGHGHKTTAKEDAEREAEQSRKMTATVDTLHCFAAFIELTPSHSVGEAGEWPLFCKIVEASPLLSCFLSYLFGNSTMSLVSNLHLYKAILRVIRGFAAQSATTVLCGELPGMYKSLSTLLEENCEIAEDLDDDDEEEDGEVSSIAKKKNTAADDRMAPKEHASSLRSAFMETRKLVQGALEAAAICTAEALPTPPTASATATPEKGNLKEDEDVGDIFTYYAEQMKQYRFSGTNMHGTDHAYSHHYKSEIAADIAGKVSKSRDKRVNTELKSLKRDLPLHFGSTIALRFDQTRPFVVKALITGPANTPYDGGCFVFDIYFPSGYPKEPPKVNLDTTGAGSVRFNPNLYNCGKVCLSLLGTWQGGSTGQEKWIPKKSTLLQVIVSVQGQILGSQYPYYNEPGVEQSWGNQSSHVSARTSKNGGYERLRVATIQHAMIGQLRHPASGFETFIREHFRIKQFYIIRQIEGWIEEAEASNTPGHKAALQKQLAKLQVEFDKLGDPPPVGADKGLYTYEKYPF